MKTILVLVLTAMIFLSNSCGVDIHEMNTSFKWVVFGNKLTYDLNMSGVTYPNFRELEIVKDPGGIRDNMTFNEVMFEIPENPTAPYGGVLINIFLHVYRLEDGLHTTTCSSCKSNPCISMIHYLKVPAKPTKGQLIPDYLCGDEVLKYDVVLSTDSIITVPYGTFETFVIQDTLSTTIKFWNEEIGLIRVDNYNSYLKDTARLLLSKKKY